MIRRIIVFAAHPDDETLGCGGTIAKRINEGYEAMIVVLTDGRHAFTRKFGLHSNPSPEELKEIRREEVIRAARILGVQKENTIFLDFEDGKLEESSERAKEKVVQILDENRPEEIFFHCNKKSENADHVAANQIVTKSVKELGFATAKYQYQIHYRRSPIGLFKDGLVTIFKRNIIHVDISEFLSQKKRAVKAFKSQITIISENQARPVLSAFTVERHLRNRESFYIGNKRARERLPEPVK